METKTRFQVLERNAVKEEQRYHATNSICDDAQTDGKDKTLHFTRLTIAQIHPDIHEEEPRLLCGGEDGCMLETLPVEIHAKILLDFLVGFEQLAFGRTCKQASKIICIVLEKKAFLVCKQSQYLDVTIKSQTALIQELEKRLVRDLEGMSLPEAVANGDPQQLLLLKRWVSKIIECGSAFERGYLALLTQHFGVQLRIYYMLRGIAGAPPCRYLEVLIIRACVYAEYCKRKWIDPYERDYRVVVQANLD